MCVTVTGAIAQYTFPLKTSANQRYFVDQNETPFLLIGDAAWDLPCALTLDSAMVYIRDADSLGFTFMEWRLLTKGFTRNAPNNAYNVAPFSGAMFQSAEVEAYWAHIDTLLDACAARNIVVWCFPAYLGYGGPGSNQGFYDEVNAASEAQMKAYGEYLGNRWQNRKNIIWGVGGDCDPTGVRSKLDSMMSGINEYCDYPRTPRNEAETWASDHWSGSETMSLTFNGFYSYSSTLYSRANDAYNWSPVMPFIEQETGYENEHSLTRQQVTAESWWSVLGGATAGMIFGNCPVWNFGQAGVACAQASWLEALHDPARMSMQQLSAILRTRHWYSLVPDTDNAVADSGYGSGTDYCTTAFASDSSCIISYMPAQHQIRVRLSRIKGDSVTCRFVNAADGTVTDLGKRARATTTFNPPGAGDWIFVADSYATSGICASVRLFLEGAYDSTAGFMNNTLRTSGILAAHFNGRAIPARAVDSVTVEIRTAASTSGSTTRMLAPAWLLADGSIRSFADTTKSVVEFDTSAGSYYVVVRHRNHLPLMTSSALYLQSTLSRVTDFTTSQLQAYGPNPMRQIGSRFAMRGGDADANLGIGASDLVSTRSGLGTSGYLNNDVDMDGVVSESDLLQCREDMGYSSQVPP